MTSISNVAATQTMGPPPSSSGNGPQALFKQLNDAISSGDISSAQQAFAQIQKNAPAGASEDSNNPMAQMMSQLGDALSSGDITKAQSALSSMQSQMKAHHGQRPQGAPPPDAATTSNGSANNSSAIFDVLA